MNYNAMSQPKVYFQTNDDASFKIGFTDNQRYLNNGEIVFPKSSLGYIVDESELITLVKPCGDPYVSFNIADTQFADLAAFEDWFAENAVSTGGGGIDPETLAELVSSAEYVSSSSTIDFKNVDGDVISTINAEPFITDGMVDNVQISGTNLVITFNVDAGKQPISIPLTDIFNPSNYYDKTATDTLLNGKVAVSDYNTYTANTNTALSGKADTSAVTASIDAVNDSLSAKADVSAVTAVADSLSGKQDTLVYYSEDTENNSGSIGTSVEDGGVTKSSEVRVASNMEGNSEVSISAAEYSDDYEKEADFYGSQNGIEISYNSADNVEGTSINHIIIVNGDGFRIETNSDDGESVNTTEFSVTADGVTINGDEIVTESDLTASLSGKLDTSAYTQVTTTTAVTSGSTDVITSGGVYAQLDGMKLRKVTESQWETISGSTDASTLYVVIPDPNQA